jgi:ADP-ribose pyrophosphatase YjhB (NUDIX family)/catechol 2,3-dioxygenase-like lactoylglutathione lyase family enzyme
MIQAIHHVQITVPSDRLGEARIFYENTLGLPLAPRPADMGRDGYWFRVFDRDLHLGIEDSVDRYKTRAHVAFKVDDVIAHEKQLKAAGITTQRPVKIDGYDRIHFRDPFGNQIELIEALRNIVEIDRPPMPKVHLSVALVHEGKLLLVRESMLNKWNLPGGHAERGEYVVPGAIRELLEETGVDAQPTGVLGVFSTNYSIRIVILAKASNPKPIAGDEILESAFWNIEDAMLLDDSNFINPKMMRAILDRLERKVSYPLEMIQEING